MTGICINPLMTMKRFFILLCLTLALAGCKKKNSDGFLEAFVVGYWACQEWTGTDGTTLTNPAYCIHPMRDHKVGVCFEGSENGLYWTLKGNKLYIQDNHREEEANNLAEIDLDQLSERYSSGTAYYANGTRVKASFINISRLIPGTWKCSIGDKSYTVLIKWDEEDEMDAIWRTEGASEMDTEIRLSTGNGRVSLRVDHNYSTWDSFTISEASDNELITTNSSSLPVKFVRQ